MRFRLISGECLVLEARPMMMRCPVDSEVGECRRWRCEEVPVLPEEEVDEVVVEGWE